MDIEKMIAVFPQYLSEYISVLFLTLQKPTLRFLPSVAKSEGATVYVVGESSNRVNGTALNPKLISFAILSIFIGSLIQGITPNHPPMQELPTLVVVVIALWLFISVVIFSIFRALGGNGGFMDTISISLQLIAVIYVVASFVSLVAGVVFFSKDSDFDNSLSIYLSTQVLLLSVYLPFALKGVHFPSPKVNFKLIFAVTFSTVFFLFIGFIFFMTTGISPTLVPKP